MKGCSKQKGDKKTKGGKRHSRRGNKKMRGGCGDCLRGGVVQNGGGVQRGGLKAFTGSDWGTSVSQWPGVSGQANNLAYNNHNTELQTRVIQERVGQNGGGLIPDAILNLGRSITYGAGSAYNTLNGYSAPVNPLPYKDQMMKR
jgi:hypothetical protein